MALDTRQARTDLYAQGTGESQVFDTQQSDFMEREGRQAKFKEQRQQTKVAGDKKRRDELLSTVAKSSGYNVKPGDVEYFRKASADLYDTTLKAISENGTATDADYLKITSLANQIAAEAGYSKQQKESLEKTFADYNENTMFQADFDAAKEAYTSEKGWSNQFSTPERVNWGDFQKEFINEVKLDLGAKVGRASETTPEEVKAMAANKMNSNPAVMHSTKREMEEQGLGDANTITDQEAVDFRVTPEFLSVFTQRDVDPTPSGQSGGGFAQEQKKPIVTYNSETGSITVNHPAAKDTTDKTVQFISDPETNEKMGVQLVEIDTDPETGEIRGATGVIVLTPAQKSANAKIDTENVKIEKELKGELEDLDEKPVIGDYYKIPFGDKNERLKEDLKEWDKKKKEVEDKYTIKPYKYKTGTKELTSEQAQEFSMGSYGVSIPKVVEQKGKGAGYRFEEIKTQKKEETNFRSKYNY